MLGEAFTYAKYLRFAAAARRSGDLDLAQHFEETAQVEHLEHFLEDAELARSNAENLRDAIDGEAYEVETMYRQFAEQAAAAARFQEIRNDEAGHRAAFQAALAKLVGEKTTRR